MAITSAFRLGHGLALRPLRSALALGARGTPITAFGPVFRTVHSFTDDGGDETPTDEPKKDEPKGEPEAGKDSKVNMSSYKAGKLMEEKVLLPDGKPVQTVPTGGVDETRVAIPLKQEVLAQLSPTFKRFTMPGKVAVVTGGARGLGLNMAQAFAESGVHGIAIMDLREDRGQIVARELSRQTGIDVRFYSVDVTNEIQVQNAVDDIVGHYGRIDVLLNSAGIADSNRPAEAYNLDHFRRQLEINITGSFVVAQAVGRHMIKLESGSIIFIASMSASVVNWPQEQCCYNTSKAGVVMLTKSLAAEWARYNIRVNSISPGYMDTALNRIGGLEAQKKFWVQNTPQKRLGAVDDLNNLAVYLASDASAFMTGNNCIIDGGYTLW